MPLRRLRALRSFVNKEPNGKKNFPSLIPESISPRHLLTLLALVVCLMALGYWYRAGATGVIIGLFILLAGTAVACAIRTLREAERREAGEKLRGSRYLLQTLVEGTSDAVYVKDLEGQYLLFNTAASRFTGKGPEEVIGKDDTFLFSPEEAKAVMEGDRAVMDSGETRTYEEHVTAAGGEKATFLSTKGPLFVNHGNTTGIFGIARDITDRRRAEDEKEKLQAQLQQAMKMEAADRLAPLHPETKVLFTSGYTDDAIVRHGVLHDDVAFIGKPYSLSVLAKKIREVLTGRARFILPQSGRQCPSPGGEGEKGVIRGRC